MASTHKLDQHHVDNTQESALRLQDSVSSFTLNNKKFFLFRKYFFEKLSNAQDFPINMFEQGHVHADGEVFVIIELTPTTPVESRNPARLLTEREIQIAILVAQGHPTKRIADRLHISEWTVSTHLRRIFVKLNVNTRAAMVSRFAAIINNAWQIPATHELPTTIEDRESNFRSRGGSAVVLLEIATSESMGLAALNVK